MKNIANFDAAKYTEQGDYERVEEGVYRFGREYVTSLSFEQEPELGEGSDATYISQYPLEDVLDEFLVAVSDFYEDLNVAGSARCYQEFSSPNLDEIQRLRSIIGKHVYLKSNDGSQQLVIE